MHGALRERAYNGSDSEAAKAACIQAHGLQRPAHLNRRREHLIQPRRVSTGQPTHNTATRGQRTMVAAAVMALWDRSRLVSVLCVRVARARAKPAVSSIPDMDTSKLCTAPEVATLSTRAHTFHTHTVPVVTHRETAVGEQRRPNVNAPRLAQLVPPQVHGAQRSAGR